MKDVKDIFKEIDSILEAGGDKQQAIANINTVVKGSGYSPDALKTAYSGYKETGEVEESGFGTGILQGLTFGFSEEIGGLVDAATGGDYDEYVKKERAKYKLYQQQNPILSTAAEVIGSLPSALIPGGIILKGAQSTGKVSTAVRASLTASAEGGVYGFGTGEGGLGNRLSNAAKEAATGAVVAAPLALAGRAVSKRLASGRLSPEERATQDVAQRVDELSGEAAEMLDQPGMALADVAGTDVQRQLRGIRAVDAEAQEIIDRNLGQRFNEQNERFKKYVYEVFEGDPEMSKIMRDELDVTLNEARLGYTNAYNTFDNLRAPKVVDLIKSDDKLASAYETARKNVMSQMRGKNDELVEALSKLPDVDDLVDDSVIPLRIIDQMKKDMDTMIRSNEQGAIKDGVLNLKGLLTQYADEATGGGYGVLRTNFSDAKSLEEALELGMAGYRGKMTSGQIRDAINQMNPQEYRMYKAGLFESLAQRFDEVGYSSDLVKEVFKSPEYVNRIKAILPNDQAFDRFSAMMANEARQMRTKRLITGGSNTADKLQDVAGETSLLDKAVEIASDPTGLQTGNMVIRGIRSLATSLSARLSSRVNRKLTAEILTETDPAKKAEILRKMAQARLNLNKSLVKSGEVGKGVGYNASKIAIYGGDEQ